MVLFCIFVEISPYMFEHNGQKAIISV